LREVLVVGLGGFCGAIGRYLVSGWVQRLSASTLPLGTLVVNVGGCMALGALMGLADTRLAISAEARLLLGIGVLGSLTTFSTFGYETMELLRSSQLAYAAGNAASHLVLGCGAVYLGHVLVRWLLG
jgi:CrcB protein